MRAFSSRPRSNILKQYQTKETIGKGTFGKVKLGINKKTNEKVAIKILERSKIIGKDDTERVEREIHILKNCSHLNVIKIFDILENKESINIIMEYCEKGELFNYIVDNQRLNEQEASHFYFQLINGLEYLHSKNFVHRDLKPENLLLGKGKILKIIDFGLSNYFKDTLLKTPCGSPCYASPEMVSGKKYNGFCIDIWSTGIILYAMLCGYLPFEDTNNDELFKRILECHLDYPSHLSSMAKSLMNKILVTNPDKRIKIDEIKKHPFYLQGKKIFESEHPELRDKQSQKTNQYTKQQDKPKISMADNYLNTNVVIKKRAIDTNYNLQNQENNSNSNAVDYKYQSFKTQTVPKKIKYSENQKVQYKANPLIKATLPQKNIITDYNTVMRKVNNSPQAVIPKYFPRNDNQNLYMVKGAKTSYNIDIKMQYSNKKNRQYIPNNQNDIRTKTEYDHHSNKSKTNSLNLHDYTNSDFYKDMNFTSSTISTSTRAKTISNSTASHNKVDNKAFRTGNNTNLLNYNFNTMSNLSYPVSMRHSIPISHNKINSTINRPLSSGFKDTYIPNQQLKTNDNVNKNKSTNKIMLNSAIINFNIREPSFLSPRVSTSIPSQKKYNSIFSNKKDNSNISNINNFLLSSNLLTYKKKETYSLKTEPKTQVNMKKSIPIENGNILSFNDNNSIKKIKRKNDFNINQKMGKENVYMTVGGNDYIKLNI